MRYICIFYWHKVPMKIMMLTFQILFLILESGMTLNAYVLKKWSVRKKIFHLFSASACKFSWCLKLLTTLSGTWVCAPVVAVWLRVALAWGVEAGTQMGKGLGSHFHWKVVRHSGWDEGSLCLLWCIEPEISAALYRRRYGRLGGSNLST